MLRSIFRVVSKKIKIEETRFHVFRRNVEGLGRTRERERWNGDDVLTLTGEAVGVEEVVVEAAVDPARGEEESKTVRVTPAHVLTKTKTNTLGGCGKSVDVTFAAQKEKATVFHRGRREREREESRGSVCAYMCACVCVAHQGPMVHCALGNSFCVAMAQICAVVWRILSSSSDSSLVSSLMGSSTTSASEAGSATALSASLFLC